MADLSIEDILKLANPRTEVVRVCIDGALIGRHRSLMQRLAELEPKGRASMASNPEAAEVRRQIADVEAGIEERKVPFKFAGIPYAQHKAIEERFPRADGDRGWDVAAGSFALIAACAVDPPMTEDQVQELLGKLHEGAADELFSAALLATQGGTSVAPLGPASDSTPRSG